jgi:predicted nuclease of predicted toxin-antitoxin system
LTPPADQRFSIYLDDCAFDYDLVAALEAPGFRAVTPKEAGLLGAHDDEHLAYAATEGHVLLTKNPRDFWELHLASGSSSEAPQHAGVLVVYLDNDPRKDMAPNEIAIAVRSLFDSGVPVTGEIHTLNHWR